MNTATTPRRRGCLFTIIRTLKWLGIILVALVLLGVVYQAVAIELDKGAYSPRGQLYTVNGHQMHLVCMGEGSPAVILQAGSYATSLNWYHVQSQLAEHTQVCAYDRPGIGWSEAVDGPRDPLTIDAELHTLLEQAGISTPHVMAGWSYGAILTRIYANEYPQETAGIVLVDSQLVTPKQFASQSDFESFLSFFNATQLVASVTTRIGLNRLIQVVDNQNVGYPADIASEITALQARNEVVDQYYAENGPAFPALQEASSAAEDLGDLPVAVLWASLTYAQNESNPRLRPLAEELATYSTNNVTQTIEGANHGSILGTEQYAQQVSDAILDVIEAAQTGEPLAQSSQP